MDISYTLNVILQAILDNIMIPIIAAFGVAILFILKPRINKVSKSIVAKNEMEELNKRNNIHKDLLELIDQHVKSAVAANMQVADAIKAEKGFIPDEDQERLRENAKKIVFGSLPPTITEDEGPLLQILGGREKLDAIIDSHVEKYVYEYKFKKKDEDEPEPEVPSNNYSVPNYYEPPVDSWAGVTDPPKETVPEPEIPMEEPKQEQVEQITKPKKIKVLK